MHSLRVDELQDLVAGEKSTVLLDVRERREVELAGIHLPGTAAAHLPMNQIPQRLAERDAARPVVCIGHHGARSTQVVAFLLRQGYPRVYNLAGGVDAWSSQLDHIVPRY